MLFLFLSCCCYGTYIQTGNGQKIFAKLLFKSNDLCGSGSGRIFALPLQQTKDRFHRFRFHIPGWRKYLCLERKVKGRGYNFSPSKCVKKALISRQTLGLFSALDLTHTFEWTFHQFAYSTATCRVFFRLDYQTSLGLLNTKTEKS